MGIALAGFLQTAPVAFGLGQLMQCMPVIADGVRSVGAAYLLWIGIGLLRKARPTVEEVSPAPRAIDRERPVAGCGGAWSTICSIPRRCSSSA